MAIKDWFRPKAEADDAVSIDDVLLKAVFSREGIGREQAMMIPEVASCVDLVCSTFALLPVKLYRREEVGGREKVVEVKDDPRVRLLNDDTGDTLDGYQFKMAMCEDYLMGKGAYAYINKSARNRIKSINYVQDKDIAFLCSSDPIFKTYKVQINGKVYEPFQFIKMLRHTKTGWSGTGIVKEISAALKTAYQTLIYQLELVEKGGNKKGFLKADRKLGKEEVETLKRAWNNQYKNSEDNVIILNKGMDFQESSNTAVEMQLNQSKATLNNDIQKIFHVDSDPDKFIKRAILPIGTAFKTALNRDFLLEREKESYFWDIDYSETLRASMKERFEAYKVGKEAGFISINEIRAKENMPQVEGLDIIDFGLGSAMFDLNTGEIYVPNTDTTKGGEDG